MAGSDFELSVPLAYIETAIPAGMTIAEYRAQRPRRKRRGLRRYFRANGAGR